MCRKPSDVIPDDPIPAALSRAERHRGRRDVPTGSVLDPLATSTSTKKTEPRRARFSPQRLRGLLAVASAGALLLMAPPAADAMPINTSPPVISGTLEPEHTLIATTGTWRDTSPIVAYEYQWLGCVQYECTDIAYANSSGFTLRRGVPYGEEMAVTVFAIDAQGETGVATSEETNLITYNGPRYTASETAVGAGFVTGLSTFAGSRTADANLACPGPCGANYSYLPGTTIELVAVPVLGASFLGWRGACVSTAATCSFTLDGNKTVAALFTGQTTTAPVLPPGTQAEPGEMQEAMGATAAPEASENGRRPSPPRTLPARLLGVRALHGHIQAVVKCQEKKSCRLSLAFFAGTTTGRALIAQRSFTVAARRSAHISLALNRTGERLLAKRHRLRVVAQLARNANGRSTFIEQSYYTLTA